LDSLDPSSGPSAPENCRLRGLIEDGDEVWTWAFDVAFECDSAIAGGWKENGESYPEGEVGCSPSYPDPGPPMAMSPPRP
jgi:hypothetical protein